MSRFPNHFIPQKLKFDVIDSYIIKSIKVSLLQFKVPLNYYNQSTNPKKINIVAKLVTNYQKDKHTTGFNFQEDVDANKEKLIVFLQGGPGFPSVLPTSKNDPSFLEPLLKKYFAVLFLDQRGTGLSTPIDTKFLVNNFENASQQFEYIKNFRADSIIFDCETIKNSLIPDQKWSVLGQSFGGFCSVTYLSFFPESLKQVLITGGIPPLGMTADDVYKGTYKITRELNERYYKRYPLDISRVNYIVSKIDQSDFLLPNGGKLTSERFQHLGLTFGGNGGIDKLHGLILKIYQDLKTTDSISYGTLATIQNYLGFETNILYFLFQEAIYCDGEGNSSNWSAFRNKSDDFKIVSSELGENKDTKFYFTGEMVYPSMINDYSELTQLKELSELIHSYKNWTNLYDLEKIKNNKFDIVPIAAATYYEDQYVTFENCEIVKRNYLKDSLRQYITNEYFHNGLRAGSDKVLNRLFELLESEIV